VASIMRRVSTVSTSHDECSTCRKLAGMVLSEFPWRGEFGERSVAFYGDGRECRATVSFIEDRGQ